MQSFSTSTVSDALGEEGIDGVVDGLTCVSTAEGSVIGTARLAVVTVTSEQGLPGLGDFIDSLTECDVMVVKWDCDIVASVFGGIACERARSRGCIGWVGDGWVRDVEDLRRHRLAVWARGSTPRTGRGRLQVRPRPDAVLCLGGATVREGDTVAIDHTGVCVVPADRIEGVLRHSQALASNDKALEASLGGDRPLSAILDRMRLA